MIRVRIGTAWRLRLTGSLLTRLRLLLHVLLRVHGPRRHGGERRHGCEVAPDAAAVAATTQAAAFNRIRSRCCMVVGSRCCCRGRQMRLRHEAETVPRCTAQRRSVSMR